MESRPYNDVHARFAEFLPQFPHQLLRLLFRRSLRRPGHNSKRLPGDFDAMTDRTRELPIGHEKLHNAEGRNSAALFAVGLESTNRLEHRRPVKILSLIHISEPTRLLSISYA